MAKNSLQKRPDSFSTFMAMPAVKQKVYDIVAGKDGDRFITSIVTAVGTNPNLAACEHGSILSAALLGEALKLSPSPQLGQFYMVPYDNTKRKIKVAQFQLGYKGYIQLAIRSGQYLDINSISVKEGELVSYDPFKQRAVFKAIENPIDRDKAETVGYFAYFELLNGFRKELYWSKEQMMLHAKTYSPGYANDLKKNTSWTFWSKNFDGMAHKTMLRQLISKWGIMSVEMQHAFSSDMGAIQEDGSTEYVDGIDIEFKDVTLAEESNPVQEITADSEPSLSNERVPFDLGDVPLASASQKSLEDSFFGG